MKKKLFITLVFGVILTRGIFAQQGERLTYEEVNLNGTYGRTITVEAIFIGYMQSQAYLEGNKLVQYQSFKLISDDKWTSWELAGKLPSIYSNLGEVFYIFQQLYISHPRAGLKKYVNNKEIIQIPSIPNGEASPIWWAKDGESVFTFYKLYVLKN